MSGSSGSHPLEGLVLGFWELRNVETYASGAVACQIIRAGELPGSDCVTVSFATVSMLLSLLGGALVAAAYDRGVRSGRGNGAVSAAASLGERCASLDCDNPAICRTGNAGDRLVCAEHFRLTNGPDWSAERAADVEFCAAEARPEVADAVVEVERLKRWLARIGGGDSPCLDQNQLRQWAYEALVLGHDVPQEP